MHDRVWYRPFIKVNVRNRRSVVFVAAIEMDRRLLRQSRAKGGRWLDVFTRSAAGDDKGCGDQEDASKLPVGRRLGDGIDQKRSTKRGAYHYRAIVEAGDFLGEGSLPRRIA